MVGLYNIIYGLLYLGIVPPEFIKECAMISSNVGLLLGSRTKIFEMSYLALSDIWT